MIEDYEEFTDKERQILSKYVSNTRSNIFVLKNLPEVIKGALFSRYSRSVLGLRRLLLKEFILNDPESEFEKIVGAYTQAPVDESHDAQTIAIKKAQNFYDKILDGYGDDSIGELGGAHLAIENVSMLAAKAIEDHRIGGSPLEKSTRYIYFDQKFQGEYLFFREPNIMVSAFPDLYIDTCNHLFETYSKLIPPLTEIIERDNPKDEDVSKVAYNTSVRAKVLDCLRGLLPASALTNIGIFGNGRFFESVIREASCEQLSEMKDIGEKMGDELVKVIPSFVRRAHASHKNQQQYETFKDELLSDMRKEVEKHSPVIEKSTEPGVRLINFDEDGPVQVAAALLFSDSHCGLEEAQKYCHGLNQETLGQILDSASRARENRRHKSPRALEHAFFTFEIVADFGAYRDLQRHRMLTQDKQLLTCDYGYYVPHEIRDTPLEKEYCMAMDSAKKAFDKIRAELPEEAQYVVPMGYNIHWYFKVNLRALQWICELRSAPAGHPTYRYIAQEMARLVSKACPQFARFFRFVNEDRVMLGRLGQEMRKEERNGSA